jgi:MarR family transcriptional regulator for hemolysin
MKRSLDRDFLFTLHDVARLIRTRADQLARAHGMTRAQWVILVRLERQPGLSQNEMAAILEVEPITVCRLVDRLEAGGFLERRADANDRRIRRLHLLPAAAPILKKIANCRAELFALITEDIAPGALEVMTEGLQRMKANLTAELRAAKSA